MQGKVSMVMTCYNKVEYIGEMFDSIIAQEWNNIELILVNDGSTDGTREMIFSYEPKFRERGFEVVIIEQANAGVCAAAKVGLERVTGDYVCVVDADDELDPKYVSLMAGWLENHPHCDIVSCGFMFYDGKKDDKVFYRQWLPHQEDFIISFEDYFLKTFFWSLWGYMLRKDYFLRCRIVETYYTQTRGSHEPGFMIPMTAYKGTVHAIKLPLVHFNRTDQHSHSVYHTFKDFEKYHDEYFSLCKYAINALSNEILDKAEKETLFEYVNFYKLTYMLSFAKSCPDGEKYIEQLRIAIHDCAHKYVRHRNTVKESLFNNHYEQFLIEAVKHVVFKKDPIVIEKPKGKVIAFGAMGKKASYLLPWLSETYLNPAVLWDQSGDGVVVHKPDFDSIGEDDILLCLPLVSSITDCVERIKQLPCRTIYSTDIVKWIADYYFCALIAEERSRG